MDKRCAAAILLVLLWVFPIGAPAQSVEEDDAASVRSPGTTASDRSAASEKVAPLIVEQTNAFRKEHDLQPVRVNESLVETARYFAGYMARTDKYGHTADGKRPSERAKEHDYAYCIVSENIAYQYSSAGFGTEELAEKFVEGWKNSPGHRKNMLDPDVTETGVAVAQSETSGHYYAVQMFGRPKSASRQFEITNESQTTIEYQIGEESFPLPPRYTRTHERCRPGELKVQLPGGDTKTLQPEDGDQFTITGAEGQIQVRKK